VFCFRLKCSLKLLLAWWVACECCLRVVNGGSVMTLDDVIKPSCTSADTEDHLVMETKLTVIEILKVLSLSLIFIQLILKSTQPKANLILTLTLCFNSKPKPNHNSNCIPCPNPNPNYWIRCDCHPSLLQCSWCFITLLVYYWSINFLWFFVYKAPFWGHFKDMVCGMCWFLSMWVCSVRPA